MLVFAAFVVFLLQTTATLGKCPCWNKWSESNVCVMPANLESAVAEKCPQEEAIGGQSSKEQRKGNFFKTAAHCMEDISVEVIKGKGNKSEVILSADALKESELETQNDELLRNPANFALTNGSLQSVWEKVYTVCGGCAVNFRCRTRKPAFACSPTIEVERTPCKEANKQPACELGPKECSVIGNQMSKATLESIKRRLNQRKTFSTKRARSGFLSKNGNKSWTKIRSFQDLVEGKLPKHHSAASSRGGFRKMEETPLPDFNCAKSGTGCFCCCQPFVPIGGICHDPSASVVSDTIPDITTTTTPQNSSFSSTTQSNELQNMEHATDAPTINHEQNNKTNVEQTTVQNEDDNNGSGVLVSLEGKARNDRSKKRSSKSSRAIADKKKTVN